jgi:hypothetical protein
MSKDSKETYRANKLILENPTGYTEAEVFTANSIVKDYDTALQLKLHLTDSIIEDAKSNLNYYDEALQLARLKLTAAYKLREDLLQE